MGCGCIVSEYGILGYIRQESGCRKFTPLRVPSVIKARGLARRLTNRTGYVHYAVLDDTMPEVAERRRQREREEELKAQEILRKSEAAKQADERAASTETTPDEGGNNEDGKVT